MHKAGHKGWNQAVPTRTHQRWNVRSRCRRSGIGEPPWQFKAVSRRLDRELTSYLGLGRGLAPSPLAAELLRAEAAQRRADGAREVAAELPGAAVALVARLAGLGQGRLAGQGGGGETPPTLKSDLGFRNRRSL